MNHRSFRLTRLLALGACLGPALGALAQIAPPPTEAPPPTPVYKRPPLVPPGGGDAGANAANGPSGVAAPGRGSAPAAPGLPDLKYESLVVKDAEGKVVRLREPATWAACRRNPTITKEDWVKLEPVFQARKTECENIVIRNLDLVEKVDSGELDRIKGDGKTVVKTIREMFQPLKPQGGNFCAKLGKDGVLTDVQSRFSQKIESEYNTAIRTELRAAMKPKTDQNEIGSIEIVRFMFLETIDETMWCYRWLIDETGANLERGLAATGWNAETLAKIEPDRKAIGSATDAAQRSELTRQMLGKLTLQERRTLLSKVIETRSKA